MKKISFEIGVFILATLGLSVLCLLSSNKWLWALSQAIPMVVAIAILMIVRREGKWKELGLAHIGMGKAYLWMAVVIMMLVISFLLAWVFGVVELPMLSNLKMDQGAHIVYISKLFLQSSYIMVPMIFAFGEELGWRGYLQTRLRVLVGTHRAICWTAVCWALFHYPFFFLSEYKVQGDIWINTLLFTIMIFPLSYLLGWIRIQSDSIWPVVWCHGFINYFRQYFAALFEVKQPYWTYVTGESGIITIVLWGILVLLIGKFKLNKKHRVDYLTVSLVKTRNATSK